jgi:hypothetical protein
MADKKMTIQCDIPHDLWWMSPDFEFHRHLKKDGWQNGVFEDWRSRRELANLSPNTEEAATDEPHDTNRR